MEEEFEEYGKKLDIIIVNLKIIYPLAHKHICQDLIRRKIIELMNQRMEICKFIIYNHLFTRK
jgi:hypothetical protein